MLKPFRVRDLLSDDAPSAEGTIKQREEGDGPKVAKGSSYPSSSTDPYTPDGIVQVTSTEYDETVTRNPDASLRYIDEDDGEFVTVGSSIELSERLDEPVLNPSTSHVTDSLDAMHIFDIRQSTDVLNTWRDFHTRSQPAFQPPHTASMPVSQKLSSPDSTCNGASDGAVATGLLSNHDDSRSIWVQHCNPPNLLASSDAEKDKGVATGEIFELGGNKMMGNDEPSYITEEGRKQAEAAGVKLRGSRNLVSSTDRPSFPASSAGENFWSSYNQSKKAFEATADPPSDQEPQGNEHASEEPSQPLLAGFGTELAKLMTENGSPQSNKEDTHSSHAAPTKQAQPVAPEHGSLDASAPVSGDPLAQTMHSLLSGVSRITADMRSRHPEVERRLSSLQENVPVQLESGLNNALQGLRNHVQTVATGIQEAAVSTRTAAERTRETEALVSAQVDGLRNLAHDLGEMGRSLFDALETRIKFEQRRSQRTSGGDPSPTTQTSSSHAQQESIEKVGESNPSVVNLSPETAPNLSSPSTSGFVLFVSNLPPDCSEQRVCDIFATQGFLGKVMPLGSLSIRDTRSAYVRFPSTYAASGALQAVQGVKLDGQVLSLEFEDSPANKNDGPSANAPSFASKENENVTREHIPHDAQQRSSSLKYPDSARRPHRRPQKANFAVPNDNDTRSLINIRRAKSLGGLRPLNSTRSTVSPNNAFQGQRAPEVPPKEPHDPKIEDNHVNDAFKEADTSRPDMDRRNSNTLLDQDNTEAEFSARYPPLLSLYRSNLPEAPSTPKPLLERGITRSATVSDRLPGSWPEEEAERNRPARLAGDVEDAKKPTEKAPRQGQASRDSQLTWLLDTENASNKPAHPVRRSATERHRNQRGPYKGPTSSLTNVNQPPPPPYPADIPANYPPDNNQSSVSLPVDNSHHVRPRVAAGAEHIDSCLRNLHALGFANGDMVRLRIYAETASGNLGDAIEMIEAERKALEWASRHQ